MATGDNVLTAISVARQCKMLDPEKEVYLGELVTPSAEVQNAKPYVTWRSTKA